MLVALFGWLPSYQFTFGSMQAALNAFPSSDASSMSPSSGHVSIVKIGDLFSNKLATDALVYHFCSTAIAVLFLSLTESARARAIFVPVFERLASAFTCCASAESLVPPPAAAAISDSDVRTSIYYATVRCISVSALTHAFYPGNQRRNSLAFRAWAQPSKRAQHRNAAAASAVL